jgi:GNAT superfamily N-acetyltransferase
MILQLRPAVVDDEPFLHALFARSETAAAFSARRQAYRIQFPNAARAIVLRDGDPVGSLLVDRPRSEIRVVDLALRPEQRGHGIGTWVMENLLAEATYSSRPLRLRVLKTNRAASLYRRLGLRPTVEDGSYLAMEWTPTGVLSCR